MYWFCLGTAAELIKVYGLIALLEERRVPWFVLNTGQSGRAFWDQYRDFNLPLSKVASLDSSRNDLGNSKQAFHWFSRAILRQSAELQIFIQEKSGQIIKADHYWIVHGDTLSTLVGLHYGKLLGLRVAHIEAGMRSGSFLEPFPEEFCRWCVDLRANFLFPPDEMAAQNIGWIKRLRSKSLSVKITGTNTLFDAVQRVLGENPNASPTSPGYAIFSVHRFENLVSRRRWVRIVDLACEVASVRKVKFILNQVTREKLGRDPDSLKKLNDAKVELTSRLPFTEFIRLLLAADFIVGDSGSNQEEATYLGVPCLLMRDRTERQEGLGENVVLSKFREENIRAFIQNPLKYRGKPKMVNISPSSIILETLS